MDIKIPVTRLNSCSGEAFFVFVCSLLQQEIS